MRRRRKAIRDSAWHRIREVERNMTRPSERPQAAGAREACPLRETGSVMTRNPTHRTRSARARALGVAGALGATLLLAVPAHAQRRMAPPLGAPVAPEPGAAAADTLGAPADTLGAVAGPTPDAAVADSAGAPATGLAGTPLGAPAQPRARVRRHPLGASVMRLHDLRAALMPGAAGRDVAPEPVVVRPMLPPDPNGPLGAAVDPASDPRDSAAFASRTPVLGEFWGGSGQAFLDEQLAHPRVLDARLDARFRWKEIFRERGLPYPPDAIFLRIFKQEQLLEVWARNPADAGRYVLLKRYEVCALSGRLGPKRRMEDFQAPEGFYYVQAFNPESNFHLSLRLSYPNPADRLLGTPAELGNDIYIHGGCATEGCFPITDEAMSELYWLAVESHAAGQEAIPVHVFPSRMTPSRMQWLHSAFQATPRLVAFWDNLKEGFDWFEERHTLPRVDVDGFGRYVFSDPASPPPAAGAP